MAVALRVLFSFAIPFSLAAIALLTVAPAIRAQASAPGDEVRYRTPDGSIKTISRAEHQSRVADLKKLIADVDSNRMVIVTATGSPMPVPFERLQDFAKWLEKKDALTALDVPGWIDDQIRKSRDLIPVLIEELEGLTSNPGNPGGSNEVEWPVPMDWKKVQGMLYVTYRADCQIWSQAAGGLRTLPRFAEHARFVLKGDGDVILVLGVVNTIVPEASNHQEVDGMFFTEGHADGSGIATLHLDPPLKGLLRWKAHFNRENDLLTLASHTVSFTPDRLPDGSQPRCEAQELITR
jgi:hypothetical protein